MSQNNRNRPPRPAVFVSVLAALGLLIFSLVNRGGRKLPPVAPPGGKAPANRNTPPSRREPTTNRPPGGASVPSDARAQMLLGNPDNAAPSLQSPNHYLLARPLLAVSYNDALRFPNWVSWRLGAGDIGNAERGQFQPDMGLPDSFTRVKPSDYTGSGYDRGHNCPSKDRSGSREENDAVFLMSNITPQMHGMNAGPWERLESYSRTLAQNGNELYITAGHGFVRPTHQTIGRNRVAVPDFGWKIVVVLPDRDGDDRARIGAQTRVIAVRMPNDGAIADQNWGRYVVTVAEIEKATGLRFFDALPRNVADALKARRDAGDQPFGTNGRGGGAGDTPAPRFGSAPARGPESGTPPGPSLGGEPAKAGQVWVNTKSGVIWREGTTYYGKTKQGKYMSEADAVAAGYHAPEGQ